MAIKLSEVNGVSNSTNLKYVADEESEKNDIPAEDKIQGTEVLVIESGKTYRMNSSGEWVQKSGSGGGGGGGETGENTEIKVVMLTKTFTPTFTESDPEDGSDPISVYWYYENNIELAGYAWNNGETITVVFDGNTYDNVQKNEVFNFSGYGSYSADEPFFITMPSESSGTITILTLTGGEHTIEVSCIVSLGEIIITNDSQNSSVHITDLAYFLSAEVPPKTSIPFPVVLFNGTGEIYFGATFGKSIECTASNNCECSEEEGYIFVNAIPASVTLIDTNDGGGDDGGNPK